LAIEAAIWIYWGFCLIAAILIVTNRQFAQTLLCSDPNPFKNNTSLALSLSWGWITTLLASTIYVLFTIKKEMGSYRLSDLITFSLVNGILEQSMFIFWFLVGCYVGQKLFLKHPIRIFASGYVIYCIYSGLIHVLFWVPVLPSHQPFAPMILILPFMSLFWMWLFWKYQAIVSILAMHVAIDFLTIGHLHFSWFESLSRSNL
jgi:chlorophyllide a hydrolase